MASHKTLPTEDTLSLSKSKAENMIAFLMGGCLAEQLILGQQTTGAGNDLERATDLARKMVCEWGMSPAIGPMTIGKKEENIFLGREFHQARESSQKTAETVDGEVRRIIIECYERAKQILVSQTDSLHRLAQALLERETLDGVEIELVVAGQPLPAINNPQTQSNPAETPIPGALGAPKTEVA